MKNNVIRLFLVFFFILPSFSSTCLSQPTLNIDLDKLFINELSIVNMTLDQVTDLLGRPTFTYTYNREEPDLFYHNLGLETSFITKSGQKIVSSITLYLIKTWDEEYSEFYLPFKGNIIPGLSSNQKLNDLPPLFPNYSIKIETAKGRYDKFLRETGKYASYVDDYAGLLDEALKHDVMTVENSNLRISIFCETATKFIDKLTIIFKSSTTM